MVDNTCSRCNKLKLHFAKGLCKSCYKTIWLQNNPSKRKHSNELGRKNYRKHILKRRQSELIRNKNRWDKAREIIFIILGGKFCIKCKNNDMRVLQFDHIYGGGNQERRNFGGVRPMIYYYASHPQECKRELQVLCSNCNIIKKYENKELYGVNHYKTSMNKNNLCFDGDGIV